MIALLALITLAASFEMHNILTPLIQTPTYIHYKGTLFNVIANKTQCNPYCNSCGLYFGCDCQLASDISFCMTSLWSGYGFAGTRLQFATSDPQWSPCVYANTSRPTYPIDFLHQTPTGGLTYCLYTPKSLSCITPEGPTRTFRAHLMYEEIVNGPSYFPNRTIVETSGARILQSWTRGAPGLYWAVRDGYLCSIPIEIDWLLGFDKPWVTTNMTCWACSFCKGLLD